MGSREKDRLGVEIIMAAASNFCRETGWVTVAEGDTGCNLSDSDVKYVPIQGEWVTE